MADTVQSFVPMTVFGRTRVISIPVDANAKEQQRQAEEQARRVEAAKRRVYYDGQQYARENNDAAKAAGLDPASDRLPEHLRRHAYSTQIQESIDFLADRLGEGFALVADSPEVQAVLDQMVAATEVIAAENDDGDQVMVTDEPLRSALVGGDTPVYVGWDPIEARPYLEFWESENVEFVRETTRTLDKVIRTEVVWRVDEIGQYRQVTERIEYDVAPNEAFVLEARAQTFWDNEEEPRSTQWLGLGRIPWTLLKGEDKSLRGMRGESLVSEQAMETADRYNAVEQIAWLISRYNSHGNLAVIGDGASLKLEQDGRVSKDVADVLTFPGGTALQVITLPTDPQMIEHQRAVLADALYNAFGLVRVEPSTMTGLGGLTGYALEILNEKTEATFRRIRRHWRKGWIGVVNLVLDVTAWKRDAALGFFDPTTFEFTEVDRLDEAPILPPEGQIPMVRWWTVDPAVVFPNRKVKVPMGSGYIVDEVKIRDDFSAGLISRKEALRKRGETETHINEIVAEIEAEQPEPPEAGRFGQTGFGAPPAPGTAAGRTVGSTSQRQ